MAAGSTRDNIRGLLRRLIIHEAHNFWLLGKVIEMRDSWDSVLQGCMNLNLTTECASMHAERKISLGLRRFQNWHDCCYFCADLFSCLGCMIDAHRWHDVKMDWRIGWMRACQCIIRSKMYFFVLSKPKTCPSLWNSHLYRIMSYGMQLTCSLAVH